ncbi:MAG: type II toxin-antitoxin system RelE/ParE family toxin [Terriglobia bacterium]|jgi:toxin ParE1/3/4
MCRPQGRRYTPTNCVSRWPTPLDDIWYYTAQESQSIEIADRVIDSITDRFLLLATHPHVGRRRDEDLRPGLRSFPVGEYVIIYRVEGEDVLILRVIRGSRDLEALFR